MGGKLKAAALLFLMFGLGIATAMAWVNSRFHHSRHKMMFGERRIAKLKADLRLTPWQESTLKEIVQDARERAQDVHQMRAVDLAQIRKDSLDAIHHLLTPAQQKDFEKMRQRWRARRHKEGLTSPATAREAHPSLQTLDRELQASLDRLTEARQTYLASVQKSGPASPESLAAKAKLDAARKLWQTKLLARRELRQRTRAPQSPR